MNGSSEKWVPIWDRKNGVCLQLHGHVSWQPKHCRSAMLDPKVEHFVTFQVLYSRKSPSYLHSGQKITLLLTSLNEKLVNSFFSSEIDI